MNNIKFMLAGCDISFVAEAPEDITLKQLLNQCDKIIPDYCNCGINSLCENENKNLKTDIDIGYNYIKKLNPNAPCSISEDCEAEIEKTNESMLNKENNKMNNNLFNDDCRIMIHMNPNFHDNPFNPYFWCLMGFKDSLYNIYSGWSESPEEAFRTALSYYRKLQKIKLKPQMSDFFKDCKTIKKC